MPEARGSFGFASREIAQAYADRCVALARDDGHSDWHKYEVEPYPNGTENKASWPFGVVHYYRHIDRPSLGWIHGGFCWH